MIHQKRFILQTGPLQNRSIKGGKDKELNLYEKIINKRAIIGVIGLGYVGLPLAVEKAKAGFKVIGFDIQKAKVEKVNRGENYIGDVVPSELKEVVKNGRLTATFDFKRISECDVVAICVPTPIDIYKQPDLSYVRSTTETIATYMHKDMLIILESTTYPGTTEGLLLPILEEKSGLKVGEDFYLAFSPERVDPGNKKYKTKNTPKVVGGVTPECTKHAKALYEAILQAPVFVTKSPKEAEMSKILENTFRIVNIALVNELAIVCEKLGIDIWEVIDAASTKPFGFMPFYPGPGVGGHCIPIDPFYLVYKAREVNQHLRLIETSGDINDYMPEYVVYRCFEILNTEGKSLKSSNILIVGITYKGDVADLRHSPSLEVWKNLERQKALIEYFDPLVKELNFLGKKRTSIELSSETLKKYDLVIITTAHKKNVDYKLIATGAKIIFDTRNMIKRHVKKEDIKCKLYVL